MTNYAQPQIIPTTLSPGDVVYTLDKIAKDIVDYFKPSGVILEPCRGNGAIFKLLPQSEHLHWCEIEEGKDFFTFYEQVDWIVTNPPYSMLKDFLAHSFQIADHVLFLIPIHNYFRSNWLLKVTERYGGIREIRWYGSGRSIGFKMGNPVGVFHFEYKYTGPITWSKYESSR